MKLNSRMCHVLLQIIYMLIPLLLFSNITVHAEEKNEQQKIRIGWYDADHFQEGSSEKDVKNGYAYEYLQSVASYTGWEYDYVYGGWADLYEDFVDGKIDLLAGVSYTEDRIGLMNFPGHEMGYESYYMYKKAGDDRISGSDLKTLQGMKVGTLNNNLMTTYFEAWKSEMNVECEEVLFDDFTSRDQAFENGEIDAFIAVNNNISANSGFSPVIMVGKSSYYLAVAAKRTDLLEELNTALDSINESNPYFIESLQLKYFQNTAVNAALSTAESQWIKNNGVLKVGYIDNYMPFCGTDEYGNITGVITDIFSVWQEQLSLKEELEIKYIPYQSYSKMITSLQEEEIDVAFPISDSIWISEQQGIVQTNNLIESSVYLIYKGEYNGDSTKVIAYSDHSPFQKNYAITHYPDSDIYLTENAAECLNAVKDGKATCTFFNSGRAEEFLSANEYEDLNRLSLGENVNCCLGVKKGNNVIYSLLERGVCLMDKSTMTNEMYKYTNFDIKYTLSEFMADNVMVVVFVAIVIIGLIVCTTVMLAISLRKTKEQNRKEQEMLAITKQQKEDLEIAKNSLQEAVETAEKASQAKTNFLFNMSHDIRTPMNAILGFANLAEQSEGDPEQMLDYIKKIKTAGDILLSILNNVLEMSRIEKGTITLEEEACNIEKFNESLFSMFDAQMLQKKISFTRKAVIKNPYIYCDVIKMREIFLNILSNAYKYTEEGGSVDMFIEELPSQKNGYMTLRTTICDTGKGMSEDFLPTLFEEFSRERNSEGNRIEGTGLGMAIVKRFVELMDGTIEVNSKLGEGSTFIVTTSHRLATREDIKSLVPEKTEKMDFTGKRLLLAEDMDVNAQIAMAFLKKSGFEVERAQNGQVCVDMVRDNPANYYNAILMDIQMPVLNGYEAATEIRKLSDSEKSNIPIIAMTANTFEEDRKNAISAGMNAHVGKPIVIEDLIGTLQQLLRND